MAFPLLREESEKRGERFLPNLTERINKEMEENEHTNIK